MGVQAVSNLFLHSTYKNFPLLVCQPYNMSISASHNVLRFANYFCCFITLFNFLSFILRLFVFMSFTIYDYLVQLFFICSFVFFCINVCFWDVLQVLNLPKNQVSTSHEKITINIWLKSYL